MNEPTGAPDPQERPQSSGKRRWLNPAITKVALIALVFGLLQIPLYMIQGTIEDRQTYNVQYPLDYQGSGAGRQTIVGPVLTVPYRTSDKEIEPEPSGEFAGGGFPGSTPERQTTAGIGYVHFFPETLWARGNLIPAIRDGGKFKSIVYSSTIELKGKFDTSAIAQKKIKDADVMWQDAFVTLGISDLRGIRKEPALQWAGRQYKFMPGTNGLSMLDGGQYTPVEGLKELSAYPFSTTLYLDGSRELEIFPAGKESKIFLDSPWKDPTFTGGFLPVRRTVSKKGFDAEWEVSYFNRNVPQVWTTRDLRSSLDHYMVGVTLATPVEFYRTTIRAVKYGCLFIVMPFLLFFIFEIATKVRIHEMQYLLVGLALSLFFLLLIAISEYLPFVYAYVIAATATIAQIAWYTRAFSKAQSPRLWKVMASVLSVLYAYLYVLLKLEDMSLLLGALGLFIALTCVLYTTRNINWHSHAADQQPA